MESVVVTTTRYQGLITAEHPTNMILDKIPDDCFELRNRPYVKSVRMGDKFIGLPSETHSLIGFIYAQLPRQKICMHASLPSITRIATKVFEQVVIRANQRSTTLYGAAYQTLKYAYDSRRDTVTPDSPIFLSVVP